MSHVPCIYIASDHHFAHRNLYAKFTLPDGTPLRPWASNSDEGDEMIIAAHNDTVRAHDKIYMLGDVAINKRGLDLLARMNGTKILIRGNHDIFRLKQYAPHFKDIRGTHKLENVILSHYPLHEGSLPHWCLGNVHGHLHKGQVMLPDGVTSNPRYFNACVEEIGLAPVPFEDIRDRLRAAQSRFAREE